MILVSQGHKFIPLSTSQILGGSQGLCLQAHPNFPHKFSRTVEEAGARGDPQGQCCLRSSLALSSLGRKVRKASPILKVKVGRKAAQKDLHLYGKTCFLGTRTVQDA